MDESSNEQRPPEPERFVVAEIRGRQVTVEFIGHALERLHERGIPQADVILCLRLPDERGLPTDGGRHRDRRYTSASRAIDVVYEVIDEDHYRVISAFRFRRLGR